MPPHSLIVDRQSEDGLPVGPSRSLLGRKIIVVAGFGMARLDFRGSLSSSVAIVVEIIDRVSL